MSHSDDFSPNKYFGRWQDILVSVGWLDSAHDYPRGSVPLDFFRALVRLLEDPWQPGVFAGRAPCAFCQFSGGPGSLVFEGKKIQLGAANLFVPARYGKVYVSPSLVAHYIDAHGYVPPEAFQEAVLECPPMGSLHYRKAIHERGLRVRGAE
jgi:hypothetical protein